MRFSVPFISRLDVGLVLVDRQCGEGGHDDDEFRAVTEQPHREGQDESRGDRGQRDIAAESKDHNPDAEHDQQRQRHEPEQYPAEVAMPLPPLKRSQQV